MSVTHFNAERVPVSLGIALDTSGSMAGDKIEAAQDALDKFLYELLDKQDEIFLYRFSNSVVLLQDWTKDRQLALARARPHHAERRHGDVRRGVRGDSARATGPVSARRRC